MCGTAFIAAFFIESCICCAKDSALEWRRRPRCPIQFVERRTTRSGVLERMAAAPAALVAELRFASSSLQQHRSCKGENGGALPAPDPGRCELAFRSERPPFFW